MARFHLDLPDAYSFSCELTVRVGDLNYGGHVGNDTMLTFMQEARVLFYRSLGFANEVSFDGSVGQMIADAAVVYKAEAFLADVLVIQLAVTDHNKYGFDLVYLVTNKATGKEVARGKTGIVCFDYERRKIAPVPERVMRALRSENT